MGWLVTVRQSPHERDGHGQQNARWQQSRANVGRRQTQAHLHVHRQQIRGAKQRNAIGERHQSPHGKVAVAKHLQVHERTTRGLSNRLPRILALRRTLTELQQVTLPSHKRRHAQTRQHQQRDGGRVVVSTQLHQAIEQHEGGHAGQRQPDPVQPRAVGIGLHTARRRGGHIATRQPQRHHGQRHHHEKNRTPAEHIHQHTTDAGANGRGQDHAHAKQPARTALLFRREGTQDDDRGNGLHNASGQAFGHTGQQNQRKVVGQTTRHAAPEQQPHAHLVDPPVTVAGQQPGRGEHGHGHGHHEARGDPLHPALAQREVPAHVGDGHVHDGRRHHRRHGAQHHRQQQQPAVALAVARLQRLQAVGALGQAHARSPGCGASEAATQAAQMQALLRAASGTCLSKSALKCTRVHQHGPEGVAPSVAMAQALGCPHKGQRQRSTAGQARMGDGRRMKASSLELYRAPLRPKASRG